ncbi:MAG: DUF3622 domain-containing protein [Arenicella sp.]|nr:DUF3622 domain-containing protein [Arenicella sp.]
MSSKKYQSEVLQDGDSWTARITRQITSRKSHVSKQQEGLASEAEANAWVETNMAEFINTQKSANSRQGGNRKDQEEIKRQRSARRAEKTEIAKRDKKESELAKQSSDTDSDSEAEFDSFDDD